MDESDGVRNASARGSQLGGDCRHGAVGDGQEHDSSALGFEIPNEPGQASSGAHQPHPVPGRA